jgi:ribosome-associated protein
VFIQGGRAIEIVTLARRIVEIAEDKQAEDIILLDIRELSTIADYFTLCSADNERQLKAIVEHIDEQVEKEFQKDPRIEGTATTGWVVMDYDDVVVHVMSKAQREYYQLERLWSNATPVLVVQ